MGMVRVEHSRRDRLVKVFWAFFEAVVWIIFFNRYVTLISTSLWKLILLNASHERRGILKYFAGKDIKIRCGGNNVAQALIDYSFCARLRTLIDFRKALDVKVWFV